MPSSTATSSNSSLSCTQCRSNHRKCNHEMPACSRCVKRGLECIYPTRKKRTVRTKTVPESTSSADNTTSHGSTTSDAIVLQNVLNPLSVTSVTNRYEGDARISSFQPSSFSNNIMYQPPMLSTFLYPQTLLQQQSFSASSIEHYCTAIVPSHMVRTNNGSNSESSSGKSSSSINQLLDACFQFYSPDYHYNNTYSCHKQEIISQFLWFKMTKDPTKVNVLKMESLDELDKKSEQALWFIGQALILQQAPASDSSPHVDHVRDRALFEEYVQIIGSCLHLMHNDFKANVEQFIGQFPRSFLLQSTNDMFTIAKNFLLDLQVFPHIGTNTKLALITTGLTGYLVITGERPCEAEIFLGALKTFVSRAKTILREGGFIVNHMTGSSGYLPESCNALVQLMINMYKGLKSTLWYICATGGKKFYTRRSLKKYIKLHLKTITPLDTGSSVIRDRFVRLKNLLDDCGAGDDKSVMTRFLTACQTVRKELNVNGSYKTAVWKLLIFMLEVYAIEIAILHDTDNSLGSLQFSLANEIAKEYRSNLPLVIRTAVRFLRVLKFITRVHIERSTYLCFSKGTEPRDHVECLSLLETDGIILDVMFAKYKLQEFEELSNKVKAQHQLHQSIVLSPAQYNNHQQELQQQQQHIAHGCRQPPVLLSPNVNDIFESSSELHNSYQSRDGDGILLTPQQSDEAVFLMDVLDWNSDS